MINPLKVLLFLAGGTAAAGAGAYLTGALDPFLSSPTPVAVANLPADSGTPQPDGEAAPKEDRVDAAAKPADQPAAVDQPAATAEQPPATEQKPDAPEVAALDPQAPAAESKPEATSPAATEPQPAAPVGGAVIPTFDLVRVEADGSMVIAGKAAANAKVELLTGGNVIGAGTADAGGDFVVILDKPLTPGDYQITIRATNPDSSTVTSVQTAIVSVPKDASGQVLAMIEEPGKPSEIITAPQPVVAAADAGQAQPKPGESAATDPAKPAEDTAATDAAKPAEGAPAAAGDQTPPAGEAPAAGTEVAAADPDPEAPATTTQPTAPAMDVAVEAVEIDGARIFVAGRAAAGSTVRVYANEIVLGETRTSAAGRFLVEAERELPVGSYIVRADVMAPDGVQVLARAAVPFEREPGENIAAVAPPAASATQTEPTPSEPAPPATAGAQPPAAEQPNAPVAEAQPPASGEQQPASGETAAPPAMAEATPPASTGEPPAADGSATPPATAEAQPGSTEQPAATAEAQPPASGAQMSPPATAEVQPPASTEPSQPAATAEAQPPAATDQPSAPADQKPADVAAVTPPAEVTAPALQSVNSAVIIRRGDTLWRISKRVYGRGTRYSTIYLANQDQIRDPDMIWPGQVFGVPDKSREGEAADLSKMGAQATTKAQ
jgi:nucleoid-associated protein YgaU